MTENYRSIEVRPASGALGAEIHGIDLSMDIGDGQHAELRRAFDEFGVIFFRDQALTPERHIAFAERWGEININRFFQPVAGFPNGMISQHFGLVNHMVTHMPGLGQ